ncbi:MAG TPA: ParB/RepB/Spo0J family partition protein, partial [Candidatus Omnitrophota bacterium]|nr:ParB/RepB/Spo0J family partition protein [Candidatus Omnitrophota bacterium]
MKKPTAHKSLAPITDSSPVVRDALAIIRSEPTAYKVAVLQDRLGLSYSDAGSVFDFLIEHGYITLQAGPKGTDYAKVLGPALDLLRTPTSDSATADARQYPDLTWYIDEAGRRWKATSYVYETTSGVADEWTVTLEGKGSKSGFSVGVPREAAQEWEEYWGSQTRFGSRELAQDAANRVETCGGRNQSESDAQSTLAPPPAAKAAQDPMRRPVNARLTDVALDQIDVTANNRPVEDQEYLARLGASIRELGLLQPVVLHKAPGGSNGHAYRLIAGGHRIEAARMAGETTISAMVYSGGDGRWEAKARLAENVQKLDLTPLQLAEEFGRGRDAGMTVAEIAADCNVSDDTVRRHLHLLRLCYAVRMLVDRGRLPIHQAEIISTVGDTDRQIALASATCKLAWDPKAADWAPAGDYDWKRQSYKPGKEAGDVNAREYVLPTGDLRKAASAVLL